MPSHTRDITHAMQLFGCGKPMKPTVQIMSLQHKAHMLFGNGSTPMSAPATMTKIQRACTLYGNAEEVSNMSMSLGAPYREKKKLKVTRKMFSDKSKKSKSIKPTTEHKRKPETFKSDQDKKAKTKNVTVNKKENVKSELNTQRFKNAWNNWNKTDNTTHKNLNKINVKKSSNNLGADITFKKEGAKGDCKIMIHKPVHNCVVDTTATLTFKEFNSCCVKRAKMFVVNHNRQHKDHQIVKIVVNVASTNCMNFSHVGFKIVSISKKSGNYRMEFNCAWDADLKKN